MSIRPAHQPFASQTPYVLHAGQFSQCGGEERVSSLEIYSPKEVILETERGLKHHVQYFDNSLSGVDEKSLSVYLQNIALQVVGLSDGKFRLAHHVTGMGAGTGPSKPQKDSQVHTLSENKRLQLSNICKNGDVKEARELLKYSHYSEESFYSCHVVLLSIASHNKKLEIMKLLLEKGANINSRDTFGADDTALMCMARSGHLDIVRFLVDLGADPDLINNEGANKGCSVLNLACYYGKIEVAQYLLSKIKNIDAGKLTPLSSSISQGHIQIVELLLSHGADPKKVPAEAIQKASGPIRKLLAKNLGKEIAPKIANKVTRDLKIDHSFPRDQADRFLPLLNASLSESDLMISLSDESKPENFATSQALAEGLVAQILRYQKNLASLSDSDIIEGFNEVLIRIKPRNSSSPPAQPLPAACSVPQANVSQPTVVYQHAAPVHRQTYQAPPHNLYAQDMQATAQMLNAFAAVENGAASFVNAIENTQ